MLLMPVYHACKHLQLLLPSADLSRPLVVRFMPWRMAHLACYHPVHRRHHHPRLPQPKPQPHTPRSVHMLCDRHQVRHRLPRGMCPLLRGCCLPHARHSRKCREERRPRRRKRRLSLRQWMAKATGIEREDAPHGTGRVANHARGATGVSTGPPLDPRREVGVLCLGRSRRQHEERRKAQRHGWRSYVGS